MGDPKETNSNILDKVRAAGLDKVKHVEGTAKPSLGLFDIKETKEVATLLCMVANKLVNKGNFLDFTFVTSAYAAGESIDQVVPEMLDVDEAEIIELHEHVKSKLKFDSVDKAQLEVFAERVTLGVLHIVLGVVELKR